VAHLGHGGHLARGPRDDDHVRPARLLQSVLAVRQQRRLVDGHMRAADDLLEF
jgi:hypothetical protein